MWSRRSPARIEPRILPRHFFFYGTLIAGSDNPVARAVHAQLRPVGPATLRGSLWAIPDPAGWYPALVAGEGRVHGLLYAVADEFTPDDLARLDDWEVYCPEQPAESLYLREEMSVTIATGSTARAHVYCFNQSLPVGAQSIPDGDFRAWLTTTGNTAYAG